MLGESYGLWSREALLGDQTDFLVDLATALQIWHF